MNQKGFANIVLIVIIVLLVGAVGYFTLVKKSAPINQQSTPESSTSNAPQVPPQPSNKAVGGGAVPNPIPVDNNLISQIPDPEKVEDWEIFSSYVGFKFRYPATYVEVLSGEFSEIPPPQSDSLLVIKNDAKKQDNGPSGANYDTDFMSVSIHTNPEYLSLKDYDSKTYASAYTNPDYSVGERVEGKVGGKPSLSLTTTYVQRWSNRGEKLSTPFQDKTRVWYIALSNDKVLLVSIKTNYSDGAPKLYEEILSTFSFVK